MAVRSCFEVADSVIAVFAKEPRPGHVKTRMTPILTREQASDLQVAMFGDVLDETLRVFQRFGGVGVVALDSAAACAAMRHSIPHAFRILEQRGPDLAARMSWAVDEAFAAGARRVVLRGSDCPALAAAQIHEISSALDECDVAICPDLGGGYVAIGLRRAARGLFDHPMSTQRVLEDTLANAQRLGLSSYTSEPSFDLDTPDDFRALAQVREALDETLCPRTLAYLDRHALWSHGSAGTG